MKSIITISNSTKSSKLFYRFVLLLLHNASLDLKSRFVDKFWIHIGDKVSTVILGGQVGQRLLYPHPQHAHTHTYKQGERKKKKEKYTHQRLVGYIAVQQHIAAYREKRLEEVTSCKLYTTTILINVTKS